ncbi:MAG: hypothetical protein HOB31_00200 [Nitrosomonadales bacterium]|nr:hypothetical protein [Nitrosomonadales bacterium]
MFKDEKNYQTEEIPLEIQNILLNYGEKQKIGISEYLRTFNPSSLKNITDNMDGLNFSEINQYLNSYLIHSKNKSVVITTGKII